MRFLRPAQLIIRSGGQTGVDRAALDCAIARSMSYAGWCPLGGWAEDFTTPPGLLEQYPHLTETPSAAPEQRTAWNVRDSDATLLVVGRSGVQESPGTTLTVSDAVSFQRPYYLAKIGRPDTVVDAVQWLVGVVAALGRSEPGRTTALVLNVAGPRESESPGIYAAARDFLDELLDRFSQSDSLASMPPLG